MTEVGYDLDRETKISNNMDALDKKWEIKLGRGSSLYFTRPNPDRPDAVIPTLMQGKWTRPELLQEQINLYLKNSWDKADAATAKAERAVQAAKEEEARVKAEAKPTIAKKVAKKKDDSGSTNN